MKLRAKLYTPIILAAFWMYRRTRIEWFREAGTSMVVRQWNLDPEILDQRGGYHINEIEVDH